jgi:hypothetical protein
MLRLLLANGADPDKPTPLMWKAVSSSYPEAVEELERHGAQPAKVAFLRTVICGGSFEMVRYLVDNGAPINPTVLRDAVLWWSQLVTSPLWA